MYTLYRGEIFKCMWIYVYTFTHTYIYIFMYFRSSYTHTHTHTHTRHSFTSRPTQNDNRANTNIPTVIHIYTHTHTHTHTHLRLGHTDPIAMHTPNSCSLSNINMNEHPHTTRLEVNEFSYVSFNANIDKVDFGATWRLRDFTWRWLWRANASHRNRLQHRHST